MSPIEDRQLPRSSNANVGAAVGELMGLGVQLTAEQWYDKPAVTLDESLPLGGNGGNRVRSGLPGFG